MSRSRIIGLSIPGKVRPNLLSLFRSYIIRKVSENASKVSSTPRRSRYYMDEDYKEEMLQLRKFYSGYFPNSGDEVLDDDEDWSEYDYYVDDDGEIIFPASMSAQKTDDPTLRPGHYSRSADDMDEYWDKMSRLNENGKHKHTKRRGSRGKKAKTIDIDVPYNSNFIDDDDYHSPLIIYYEDYHDKYSRIEFTNLYEFDEYCNNMGFCVPPYVAEQIAYSSVSHCCLNPIAKDRGVLEIMREDTYGDLFYEACETNELGG